MKPSGETQTSVYSTFRGADFSTDPSLVEKYRSPLCTNIIADAGGMPEKRPGWRTLHRFAGERINGIYSGVWDNETRRLVHAGTNLYRWDETETEPVLLLGGLPDEKSRGAALAGVLWIVTGAMFLRYDGESAERVTAGRPYVPTVIITRSPTGGGAVYEDINMLTPYRKNSFQTDGSSTIYQLDSSVDAVGTVTVWVWDEEKTEGTDYTLNRGEGTVTFTTPPAAPAAGQADGVVVEFPHTVEGYSEMIEKCTIITTYGVGTNDRLVLSGNPDYPNRDWIGGLNDGSYWPDLQYSGVGAEGVPIVGYCRVGSYQAIVKDGNGQDTTVYLRSAEMDGEGNARFPMKQSIAGVGASAGGSFATLMDEPLFLSDTGIYAITTSALTSNQIAQNRSYYLNAKLVQEKLRDAEAVYWNGLYILSVGGGRVYLLDGRQRKSYRSESLGDFVYEGYYWENVPARMWHEWEGALYFGTEDGRLCRMNTDTESVTRYSDDGAAIDAVWATKYDDDGTPGVLKSINKRGCCVTIKPYTRSSATVYFRSDRSNGGEREVARDTIDILSWEDIDFARFTFDADDSPREIFFNTKVKNYKRLQIIIRNSEVNEGFGVYQITKIWKQTKWAKR